MYRPGGTLSVLHSDKSRHLTGCIQKSQVKVWAVRIEHMNFFLCFDLSCVGNYYWREICPVPGSRQVTWAYQRSDPASASLHVQKQQFLQVLVTALHGSSNLL